LRRSILVHQQTGDRNPTSRETTGVGDHVVTLDANALQPLLRDRLILRRAVAQIGFVSNSQNCELSLRVRHPLNQAEK
jgi:hypothetical protein